MKITIHGYVHKMATYGDDYLIFASKFDSPDYVPIGPITVEYEIPADFDPISAQVEILQAALEEQETAHRAKCSVIRDKIASLLCIENQSEVVS